MNKINLRGLELKVFIEQDALDYCQLNDINLSDITELDLSWNKLTDISGIKLFKNLKYLDLDNNELTDIFVLKDLNFLEFLGLSNNNIKDISIVKNLTNLKALNINDLKLRSNQIQYINSCKNLKELICNYNGFKNKSVLKQLNKNINYY